MNLGNMNVSKRMLFLIVILLLPTLVIGLLGLRNLAAGRDSMHDMYEAHMVASTMVGRIAVLNREQSGEMFRAIQHNPAGDYAKLHDHPVTEHTNQMDKNVVEINALWEKYETLPKSEEGKKLTKQFKEVRESFVSEVLRPGMDTLRKGDYSTEAVGAFLRGNRKYGKPSAEAADALIAYHKTESERLYNEFSQNFNSALRFTIGTVGVALILAGLLGILITRSITRPLTQMQTTITEVEKNGDFTRRIPVSTEDEVGQTAKSFNELMATLQQTLGQVLGSVAKVSNAAQTLSAASGQVATSSSSQSEATSSMAAAVEEMTVSINHVSDSAREAVEISRKSGKLSTEGGEVINRAASEMSQIAETVRHTAQAIEELDQHSNQISSIVQVIKEVADQTNLLALNAAIEAARAGEQGRGFAVVADEVRKLAERTTKATEEITQMIAAMQHSAKAAVSTMETAVDQVGGGVALANQAGSAIIQIKDGAEHVVGVVNDISSALAEQSSASNDIAAQVEKVAQMTEENSAAAAETSRAANNLQELASDMRATVSRFKI